MDRSPSELLAVAAGAVLALGVLWRYLVVPAWRIARAVVRAVTILADRYEAIPAHTHQLGELTGCVKRMAAQGTRNHDWTAAALTTLSNAWNERHPDTPVYLPERIERNHANGSARQP